MMTDEEIYEIGMMLEEKGLSHSEIDYFLEHHGVKGQKWGVRKSRKEMVAFAKNSREIVREGNRAETPAARKAAAARYKSEVLDKVKDPVFKEKFNTATKVTKGEMFTHVLVFGPFAGITIKQAKKQSGEAYDSTVDAAHEIYRELSKP
jgi:hypothetical protein